MTGRRARVIDCGLMGRRGQHSLAETARESAARKTVQTRTLKAQVRFLRDFANAGVILHSARAAGVNRQAVYQWRLHDPEFLQLYQAAKEEAVDQWELEAVRRGVKGVLTPVYQQGKLVGRVREYSDNLLITLLKGHRPDTYRERQELTGRDGRPLFPSPATMSTEELRLELVRILGELGPEPEPERKALGPALSEGEVP